ncbi:Mor transcription activator family protein [uncultured Thiocystis sp.]|jgi:Mor family transcriptional regulator|uniref:Mor transcription activator family protein n=1 Tax=uncultured Thiocystis sp. TaxID=1202134 RepID=UPI0025FF9A26|nr:Mor transcription activator family protein [uncultured Thiocystis sp.]
MPKDFDTLVALHTQITRIVREATGLHEQLALPVAEAICAELQHAFGGAEIYIPAPSRTERNQAILDDWHGGRPIPAICRKHGIARATVYRLLGARGKL